MTLLKILNNNDSMGLKGKNAKDTLQNSSTTESDVNVFGEKILMNNNLLN